MRLPSMTTLLTSNGVFSLTSGLVALVGAAVLDETLGIPSWLLAVIGVNLVGYGIMLVAWSRRPERVRPGTLTATIGDISWVIGAAVVLLGFPDVMTTTGRIVLLSASLVVLEFAVLQALALRHEGVAQSSRTLPRTGC